MLSTSWRKEFARTLNYIWDERKHFASLQNANAHLWLFFSSTSCHPHAEVRLIMIQKVFRQVNFFILSFKSLDSRGARWCFSAKVLINSARAVITVWPGCCALFNFLCCFLSWVQTFEQISLLWSQTLSALMRWRWEGGGVCCAITCTVQIYELLKWCHCCPLGFTSPQFVCARVCVSYLLPTEFQK